ncbi:MAG: GAF domain-containing protein, partial [Gammaproteobacteria bacterium]|nr:GAF domain-containing protein [Gammaproteobacteria bacterium]
MSNSLGPIKYCFEGVLPSGIATCSADGIPNVTYLSQVQLIDDTHVGLSYQFFNKTKTNITENPQASLLLIDPFSGTQYRLQLRYERTETSGENFEKLKVKLDAVASMSGMSKIFKLKGVDIYLVSRWECMEENASSLSAPTTASFSELNEITQRISQCDQLAPLLDTALSQLEHRFGYTHSMILFMNPDGKSLYTIASHGYTQHGAGAEVRFGEGIIGTVAEQRKAVKISNMKRENIMADAIKQQANKISSDYVFKQRIELPGLKNPKSQLAVPIEAKNSLLGVLFIESEEVASFNSDIQELISSIANHLGTAILLCDDETQESSTSESSNQEIKHSPSGNPLKVRFYLADKSIFIDNDYIIKGVAGAILNRLLSIHLEQGRIEFTNRELRLDPEL